MNDVMRRTTRQLEAIRSAIEGAGRPLGFNEIHAVVRSSLPGIGIATIYRNLKHLLAIGQIHTVMLPGEHLRYSTVRAARQQPCHFHCNGCGKVFDMGNCPVRTVDLAPAGFQASRCELTLYGHCAECNAGRRLSMEPAAADKRIGPDMAR